MADLVADTSARSRPRPRLRLTGYDVTVPGTVVEEHGDVASIASYDDHGRGTALFSIEPTSRAIGRRRVRRSHAPKATE